MASVTLGGVFSDLAQPGPRPPPDDEPLMRGVRAGDLTAFEQLVLRYQTDAWGVACGFTAR
ncbi:MAG: hypothetical protein JXB13_15765 [Phycisphaerae bacterium]|nr:hypothetical protein [Phycisphaerae bacterium]